LSEERYLLVNNPVERYFYQYYRPPAWVILYLKIPYKILLKIQKFTSLIHCWYIEVLPIGLKDSITPFNENFIYYASSQWHTLSRKCLEYVADFTNKNSSLVNYYEKTILPEESIIATILVNSKRFKICNDHKRYLEFLGDSAHPRILTAQDYSTLTNGNFHFARKFEQDTEILDMLDSHIFS